MKLTIHKSTLLNKFIIPVSKISDKCIITLSPNHIHTVVTTNEGNPVLYASVNIPCDIENETPIILNIPSVNKFSRILNCINSDAIELDINSNNIEYNSLNMKFRYHLLEDGVIENSGVNPEKIKSLEYDSNFIIDHKKTEDIIKSTTFTSESNKLYFYMKDNKVYAEITDKEIANTDSVSYFITDQFNGTEIKKPMLIDLEIFKLFYGIKDDITVKINTKKRIISFNVENSDYVLQYIVSTLIK